MCYTWSEKTLETPSNNVLQVERAWPGVEQLLEAARLFCGAEDPERPGNQAAFVQQGLLDVVALHAGTPGLSLPPPQPTTEKCD